MSFTDLVNFITPAEFQLVGSLATYTTEDGIEKETYVILEQVTQSTDSDVTSVEIVDLVQIQRADIPSPRRGDILVIDGKNFWMQEALDDPRTDEWVQVWSVIPQ